MVLIPIVIAGNLYGQVNIIDTLKSQSIKLSGNISAGAHFYSNVPEYSGVGNYSTFFSGNINLEAGILPIQVQYDLNYVANGNNFYNKFSIRFDKDKFQEKLKQQLIEQVEDVEANMQDVEAVNKLTGLKNNAIYDEYPKSYTTMQNMDKIMGEFNYSDTKDQIKGRIQDINNTLNEDEVKDGVQKFEEYVDLGYVEESYNGYKNTLDSNDSLYREVQQSITIKEQVEEYKAKEQQYKRIKNSYNKTKKDKKSIEEMQQSSYTSFLNKEDNVVKGLRTFDMLTKKMKVLNSIKDFQIITVNKKMSDLTLNNVQLLGMATSVEYEKFFHLSFVAGVDRNVYSNQNNGNILRRRSDESRLKRTIYSIRSGIGSESGDFIHFIYMTGKDKVSRITEDEGSLLLPKRNNILSGIAQKTFLNKKIKIGGEVSYAVTTNNTLNTTAYNSEIKKPIMFKSGINSSTINDYAFNLYGDINVKKASIKFKYLYKGDDYYSMGTYYTIPGNAINLDYTHQVIPNKISLMVSYTKQFSTQKKLNQKRNYDNFQANIILSAQKQLSVNLNYSIQNYGNKFQLTGEDTTNMLFSNKVLTQYAGVTLNKSFSSKKITISNVLGGQYGGSINNKEFRLANVFYTVSFLSKKGFSLSPSMIYQFNQNKDFYSSLFQAEIPIEHHWKKGYSLGGGVGLSHSKINGWIYRTSISTKLKLYKTMFLNLNFGVQNTSKLAVTSKKYILTGLISLQYQFNNLNKKQ